MRNNNDEARNESGIPQNNPSKAMDSKQEVEQSNDAKIGEDMREYPTYPANEDIMHQDTGNHRVDVDVENLPNSNNLTGVGQRYGSTDTEGAKNAMTPQPGLGNDDLNPRSESNSEYDISEDELAVLNGTDAEIGTPQNVSNEDINTDLDTPGSEDDDAMEAIGEEDEENNYYSLGGDNHENLEEDRGV